MLSGIRTVASLNAEKIELERYGKHLDGAYKAGIKEGMAKGVGNGALFVSFYMSYALAFWFGTKQVRYGAAVYGRHRAVRGGVQTDPCYDIITPAVPSPGCCWLAGWLVGWLFFFSRMRSATTSVF